jgi:hypothetical protein
MAWLEQVSHAGRFRLPMPVQTSRMWVTNAWKRLSYQAATARTFTYFGTVQPRGSIGGVDRALQNAIPHHSDEKPNHKETRSSEPSR